MPFEKQAYGDGGLDAGQRCAQAVVRAVAETEVALWAAADVEAVGVGVVRRVAGGGGEGDEHRIARRDGGARQLQRLGRETERGGVDGGVVAQRLLHGAPGQLRLGAQAGELVGVGEQAADGRRDQVDGGLVPGDQDEEGHAEQFPGGERAAVGGVGQVAEQLPSGLRRLASVSSVR
ncbi:hypothetical protein SVIOM342S_08710 [Streptomyces violaceorubidus]